MSPTSSARQVPSLIKDAQPLEDRRLLYLHGCQKIFVQRDYSSGLNVRFNSVYPPQLTGKISQHTWDTTISTINDIFAQAEAVGLPSIVETVMGCLTCYCSRLVTTTIYEKKMAELEAFIEQQNKDIYMNSDILILNPLERGLRVIEIVLMGTDPNHFDHGDGLRRQTTTSNGTL